MTPEQAIEAAGAVEAEVRYRLQSGREAYEAGRQAGYRQAKAEEEARWRQAPRTVVHGGPSHAQMEARRWGPGGREHFADPRPGDFPGRDQSGRVLRYSDPQRTTEIWSAPQPDGTLAGSSRPLRNPETESEQEMEASA
jgi:hypothetical protein